ncbi:MAG TPA: cytochrome c-type biogenesis protein CcmH [Thermoleophilia bacterium]|nr:cytochrome c-type biogenesis protein CcmH [Thermoleophilia bacterium]
MRSEFPVRVAATPDSVDKGSRGRRRRAPLRFIVLMAVAVAVLVPSVAFAATPPRSSVSDKIICQCGCGAVLTNCPHQNCGWGVPAKAFIDEQLVKGKTSDELVQYYVSQYGEVVLAAPTKTGFNVIGWVMPFVGLIVGAVAIYFLIGMWSARRDEETVPAEGATALELPDPNDPIARRLNDELRDFD